MANIFTREARILTTHTGVLPRLPTVLDLVKARAETNYDPIIFEARVSAAVEACVRKQAENGVDIVADGEEKTSFFLYIQDRLAGVEPRPRDQLNGNKKKCVLFLEDFERYLQEADWRGSTLAKTLIVCTGPIEYVGQEQLQRDLDNLRSAAEKVECSAAFMPSIAPSGVDANEYYRSDEEFFYASGEALRVEYNAIVDAGFLLQIDDPFLPATLASRHLTPHQAGSRVQLYIEALNHSLRGIPAEKIRYNITRDVQDIGQDREVPFVKVARHMLHVNAGAYSFDASKTRYEDDVDMWDTIRFPNGKVIVPGIIADGQSHSEDPEYIAERLVQFAGRVGRDNVLASADSGITRREEGHSGMIWSKFPALRKGAELATQKLWS
jgi:5-methyltetrahydropteroyltriglutamate--homocysteine methyltransferase